MTTKRICLFDVDGTLTKPRQVRTPMIECLEQVRCRGIPLAVVGGSDMPKILEQLDCNIHNEKFSYIFSENGLVSYRGKDMLPVKTIQDEIGEVKLQKFINYCLSYMSNLELPCKRGNFVEFRKGMLNISPIGRSCSQKEREEFVAYDEAHRIRSTFVEDMKHKFPLEEYSLQFSIGGQISIDVFPVGWDKRFCLQYLINDGYSEIYFFGDKTEKGGNDYEIYSDERTIGHRVSSPADTVALLTKLFL
ncbi:unnamed protein product [Soboliphyme baturini]|uniref:Phosphomannomutase n=1 Tax=Soboliphyme baturini TaxID=241478 RepID=A0A183IZD7_9BILA|nr:unnamed protein product [Soboliphyme baturini]